MLLVEVQLWLCCPSSRGSRSKIDSVTYRHLGRIKVNAFRLSLNALHSVVASFSKSTVLQSPGLQGTNNLSFTG